MSSVDWEQRSPGHTLGTNAAKKKTTKQQLQLNSCYVEFDRYYIWRRRDSIGWLSLNLPESVFIHQMESEMKKLMNLRNIFTF